MTKLAVIAIHSFEQNQLREVWKFFPFQKEIQYHYLYAGADDSSELPEQTNFVAQAFPGEPQKAVTAISEYLANKGISLLCFAGFDSHRVWTSALKQNSVTLYSNKNLTLADISSLTDASEAKLEELLKLTGLRPAILRKETESLALPKDASVYTDFQSFQSAHTQEMLVTANIDLISAVCGCNLRQFTVSHVIDGAYALDLALTEAKMDYLQILNRLHYASQLALLTDDTFNPIAAQSNPRVQTHNSYSFFAEYYDNYMSHVNYDDWLGLMLGWYKQYSPKPVRKVLEIACGTANAASILVFRGYEVDACDSSPFMLHIADSKTFKPNVFLRSLTDPLPKKDYDLIFCLFDSINYLTHKADIKTLLRNVHAALRPGGVFIFDISTLLNSLENFNETTSLTRVRDGYLIHNSNYEILSNRQITSFTLFRRNNLSYERLEEKHSQRVYRSPELAEMISSSPLKLKAIHAPEMRTNLLSKLGSDIDNRYFRLFFVLQKDE